MHGLEIWGDIVFTGTKEECQRELDSTPRVIRNICQPQVVSFFCRKIIFLLLLDSIWLFLVTR